jgi:hypothetical protein
VHYREERGFSRKRFGRAGLAGRLRRYYERAQFRQPEQPTKFEATQAEAEKIITVGRLMTA